MGALEYAPATKLRSLNASNTDRRDTGKLAARYLVSSDVLFN